MNNKYFSMALLYDERKNIMYSATAYMITFLTNIFAYFSSIPVGTSSKGSPVIDLSSTNISILFRMQYFLLFGICITTVFYSYINKEKKYAFMLTQPYGRDSIIITRTFAFMLSYTVPLIIYGIISSIILINNSIPYSTGYTLIHLLLKLISTFSILTFCVLLLQLMQMFFGKNITAFIFPPIILSACSLEIALLDSFTSKIIPFLHDAFGFTYMFLQDMDPFWVNNTEFHTAHYYIYNYLRESYLPVSIFLIASSILILYWCVLLNRRLQIENISELFMFKFSEVIFNTVFSILITMISTLMLCFLCYNAYSLFTGRIVTTDLINRYGLKGKENIEQTAYLIMNILWIPITVFSYKILAKSICKRRRSNHA